MIHISQPKIATKRQTVVIRNTQTRRVIDITVYFSDINGLTDTDKSKWSAKPDCEEAD